MSQEGKWLNNSHNVASKKESRQWMTYLIPHCCLYRRAERANDLLMLTQHCCLYKRAKSLNDWSCSQPVAWTKKPRVWMTHLLPQCCIYNRAKRAIVSLTPTMLPIKKETRGWMTYSLPNCCLYKRAKKVNNLFPHCCLYKKRAKRVNDLLTPTVSPVKKNKEDELLTHSYTVAYTKELRGWMLYSLPNCCLYKKQRSWMTYSLPHCCLYKRAKRVNDLLTPILLPIQKCQEHEWLSPTLWTTQEPRG